MRAPLSSARSPRARGFTLIETIVVLLVVGIVAMVVIIPGMSQHRSIQASAVAQRIASDLRYAQQLALTTQVWHGVRFSISPTNQWVVYSTTGAADTPVDDPGNAGAAMQVDLNPSFPGVSITEASFQGQSQVEFSPLGDPYNDKNGQPLNAQGRVTVTAGGNSRTVLVERDTGRVSLQ